MKSIKKLFNAPILLGSLMAVTMAFAGCNNSIDGTKLDYSEKEKEVIGTTGPTKAAYSANVNVEACGANPVVIDQASTKNSFRVIISNYYGTNTKVNVDSVKKAVKAYKLKENTDNSGYYPMHDGELPVTFVSDIEGSKGIDLTLLFDVDTSEITTNKIAVIVDGTVVKDEKGTYILNYDGNTKAGEVSDSVIQYLTVTKKADGTPATGLSIFTDEDFCPTYSPINFTSIPSPVADTDKATWTFELPVRDIGSPEDTSPVYDKTLASKLNSSYILRIKDPESNKYEEKTMSWEWKDTLDNVSLPGYTATSSEVKPGSVISILMTVIDCDIPDWYEKVYGHPALLYFVDEYGNQVLYEKGTKIYMDEFDSDIFASEPSYIVNDFSASEQTWANGEYDADDIKAAQKSFFKTVSYDSTYNRFEVEFKNAVTAEEIEFASYNEFIIASNVDPDDISNYVDWYKIDCTVKALNKADGKFWKLVIEPKNKTLKDTIKNNLTLFVGNGTTLNKNTGYKNQTSFGMYKDASKGVVSGYVALN